MIHEEITNRIIGAAITVHREVGPGLLESTYQTCMELELKNSGIAFQKELQIPLIYKNNFIPNAYKVDFIVEGKVVVELKTVDKLAPVHTAQLMTY